MNLTLPKRHYTRKTFICFLLIAIAVISAYEMGTSFAPSTITTTITTRPLASVTPTVNQWAMGKLCSLLVSTDGTTTYAQSCDTGAIFFSGTTAGTIINSAIANLTSGGLIHVKTGTYQLSGAITSALNNIIFEGEGTGTLFTLAASFAEDAFSISGSNWVLRDFKLDATNQVHAAVFAGIYVSGNNETITSVTIYSGDHGGIRANGSRNRITDNIITNNHSDGIILLGSDSVAQGNIIDTTTNNNGISLVTASNVTVTGNSIKNTNNGIALENLGSGMCQNVAVTGNSIRGVKASGIVIYQQNGGVDSAQHVTISGNTITSALVGIAAASGKFVSIADNSIYLTSSYGIEIDLGQYYAVTGNMIDGPSRDGIEILTGVTGVTIVGNIISNFASNQSGLSTTSASDILIANNVISSANNGTTGLYLYKPINVAVTNNTIVGMKTYGIFLRGASVGSGAVISGNTIRTTDLAGTFKGIYGYDMSHVLITGNSFYSSGVLGRNRWAQAIMIRDSVSSQAVISSNYILGDAGTAIWLYNGITNTTVSRNLIINSLTGILEDTGGDYNTISENYITGCTNTILLSGAHSLVINNKGYNPLRHIATPFDTTNHLVLDRGSSATPSNTTTMTVGQSPKLMIVVINAWTAGHTLVIKIDGTQVISVDVPAANTVYSFMLQPGETFYCQYQASQTTFTVSGE